MVGRGERRGLSLPLKLVLTLTAVLGCVMLAAAFFNFRALTRLADREAKARRQAFERDTRKDMTLLARAIAIAAALPLAGGDFADLDAVVAGAVKEDPRIIWIFIVEAGSNRIVARSAGAPDGETWSDVLTAPIAEGPPNQTLYSTDVGDRSRFILGTPIAAGDRIAGQLRAHVTTAALESELEAATTEARSEAGEAATQTLVAAALILGVGVVLGCWQGFRLARPLRDLSEQAHRIAGGDLQTRVAVRNDDEIGRLGTDFNFMADRLGTLLAETASRASLQKEMSLACGIQASMNPPRGLQEIGPFRVVGTCEPAADCGGDWWMVGPLSRDRLLIVVGDVTGHGIPAAMVAATACGAAWALTLVDGDLDAEGVLRAIDGAIRGVGRQKLLMTCFAAIVDPQRGTVEYSNAGHNFPYVVPTRDAGAGARRDLAVLALRGSPLGNRPGDFVLGSGTRQLAPGDVLVLFTDGVVDRIDSDGNRFGDRRLRGLIAGAEIGRHGEGLAALRDGILAAVGAFARDTAADDDMAIVLVQYDPAAAGRGASA